MGWLIDNERKGYESIGCYTYYMASAMALTLDFQGEILKKSVS